MDLALEMGMTADGLLRSMSARELEAWRAYSARKMLPQRRIEIYLAQIAMWVAKAFGGAKDATLDDFMFDPDPIDAESDEDGDAVPDAGDLAAFFGAVVVPRKD